MKPQQHYFDRVSLDLTLNNGDRHAGLALQERFSLTWSQDLLPALDEALGQVVPPDRYIRIERLELDLGSLPINVSNLALREKLRSVVNDALSQIQQQRWPDETESGFAPQDLASFQDERDSTDSKTRPHSPLKRQREAFRWFLQHGSLPWWFENLQPLELAQSYLEQQDLEKPEVEARKLFVLLHQKKVRQRLARQFPSQLVLDLSEFTQRRKAPKSVIQTISETLLFLAHQERDLEYQFLEILLEQLLLTQDPNQITLSFLTELISSFVAQLPLIQFQHLKQALISEPGQQIPITHRLPDSILVQAIKARIGQKNPQKEFTSSAEVESLEGQAPTAPNQKTGQLETSASERTETRKKQSQGLVNSQEEEPRPGDLIKTRPSQEDLPDPEKEPGDTESGPQTWQIQNAGLVLLNPYLKLFFERLGLKSGVFDEQQRAQSALALQYLIDGPVPYSEHLLPLNKLLCGLPMDWPLPNELRLSEEQQNQCHELLEAVIRNWSALKNTSVEGFRQTFLRREGRLSFEFQEKTWRLRVDHQSYDLLLEYIPWTYQMLAFSWMPFPLIVDWI